jgi:hypothetical protein
MGHNSSRKQVHKNPPSVDCLTRGRRPGEIAMIARMRAPTNVIFQITRIGLSESPANAGLGAKGRGADFIFAKTAIFENQLSAGVLTLFNHVVDGSSAATTGKRPPVCSRRGRSRKRRSMWHYIEALIRVPRNLTKDSAGEWWLMPESNSPEFQQWTKLEGHQGGITIELIGRVRYAMVPED